MRTPQGNALSEFERERAECGGLLRNERKRVAAKSEDTFNANEQAVSSSADFAD